MTADDTSKMKPQADAAARPRGSSEPADPTEPKEAEAEAEAEASNGADAADAGVSSLWPALPALPGVETAPLWLWKDTGAYSDGNDSEQWA